MTGDQLDATIDRERYLEALVKLYGRDKIVVTWYMDGNVPVITNLVTVKEKV